MYDIDKEYILKAVDDSIIPNILYKYREINQKTINILKDAEFWFAKPDSFNDPFDCKLSETRNHTISEFRMFLTRNSVPQDRIENIIKKSKANPNKMREQAIKSRDKIFNQHGILSLSKTKDNILMWSHYASCHTGLVIALHVKEDPKFFVTPMVVKYQETYKELNHYRDGIDAVERNVSTKSKNWEYEEEVRILKEKHGAYPVERGAVRAIYFGCKTSDSDIKSIISVCKSANYKNLKFYRATVAHGAFKLVFNKYA